MDNSENINRLSNITPSNNNLLDPKSNETFLD